MLGEAQSELGKRYGRFLIFHPSQVAWLILEPYLAPNLGNIFEGSLGLVLPYEEGQKGPHLQL